MCPNIPILVNIGQKYRTFCTKNYDLLPVFVFIADSVTVRCALGTKQFSIERHRLYEWSMNA